MTTTIPSPEHRCWQRLSSGNAPGFQTRQLGLQLLFKRIQGDPGSTAQKAGAVHAFFVKYEKILAPEINQLVNL